MCLPHQGPKIKFIILTFVCYCRLRGGIIGLSLAYLFGAIEMTSLNTLSDHLPDRSSMQPDADQDWQEGQQGGEQQGGEQQGGEQQGGGQEQGNGQEEAGGTQFGCATGRPTPHSPQFSMRLSMLELYNESLRDLLAHAAGGGQPLQLLDDPQQGVRVQGLTGECGKQGLGGVLQ